MPNRVVMKAALPAARPDGLLRSPAEGLWLGTERGLELCRSPDFHLLELLLRISIELSAVKLLLHMVTQLQFVAKLQDQLSK